MKNATWVIAYKDVYEFSGSAGSRSKALPMITNNDKTTATHEATDTRTKKNYNRETAFERSVEKLLGKSTEDILYRRALCSL